MMKRSAPVLVFTALAIASLLTATALVAQGVAEIPFDSALNPLKLPDAIHLGEAAGVATNSKGHVFVYTRTGNPTITLGTSRAISHGGSRLFEFDQTGKFVREIGQGIYGFIFAQAVRIDREDNIWTVDQASNQVIKFNPDGRVVMVIGRKPEALTVPGAAPTGGAAPGGGRGGGRGDLPGGRGAEEAAGRGAPAPPAGGGGGLGGGRGAPGAGIPGETFNRPTDVAWDAAGNIYIADGIGNARVVKYDKNGTYL